MENSNPIKNPITTILGIVFLVIGLGMFIMPLFTHPVNDVSEYIKASFVIGGVVLILIPDDLTSALKTLLNRKANEI